MTAPLARVKNASTQTCTHSDAKSHHWLRSSPLAQRIRDSPIKRKRPKDNATKGRKWHTVHMLILRRLFIRFACLPTSKFLPKMGGRHTSFLSCENDARGQH